MIYIEGKQEGDAWHRCRWGTVTGSQFKVVVKAGAKGNPLPQKLNSAGVMTYAKKLAEQRCRRGFVPPPEDAFVSPAMQRGTELEPRARAAYEMETGNDVDQWRFIYRDETHEIGTSPDGTVGDDGGYEVKCPDLGTLLSWHYDYGPVCPPLHIPQVQGCMWVTNRKWWDFQAWRPPHDDTFPEWVYRVERDEEWMAAFDEHIVAFNDRVNEIVNWRT